MVRNICSCSTSQRYRNVVAAFTITLWQRWRQAVSLKSEKQLIATLQKRGHKRHISPIKVQRACNIAGTSRISCVVKTFKYRSSPEGFHKRVFLSVVMRVLALYPFGSVAGLPLWSLSLRSVSPFYLWLLLTLSTNLPTALTFKATFP